jgi:NCS1 family nucleobase:cation symporter-1
MVAALMWIDAAFYQPSYTGPISKALGGSDLSWLMGIVVGAGVYAILSARTVKREAELTPGPGTTTG